MTKHSPVLFSLLLQARCRTGELPTVDMACGGACVQTFERCITDGKASSCCFPEDVCVAKDDQFGRCQPKDSEKPELWSSPKVVKCSTHPCLIALVGNVVLGVRYPFAEMHYEHLHNREDHKLALLVRWALLDRTRVMQKPREGHQVAHLAFRASGPTSRGCMIRPLQSKQELQLCDLLEHCDILWAPFRWTYSIHLISSNHVPQIGGAAGGSNGGRQRR
jgi:hypothetical protein